MACYSTDWQPFCVQRSLAPSTTIATCKLVAWSPVLAKADSFTMTYVWHPNLDPRPLKADGSLEGSALGRRWCGLGEHNYIHTKHARMPSHRLRRTTPNLPTNRRQLYPALAATIGGEVFLGQTRQTPTDPRNLLMLARASCTRCRDCGREDSATSLDADALRRWQAKSMPGHVIAHILDSW